MSLNNELVDRWRWKARRARAQDLPLRVSTAQRDELARLGSTSETIYRRRPDGTETAFDVLLEVRHTSRPRAS